MSSKAENTRSPMVDSVLLFASAAMLLGGIFAYYYYRDLAVTPVRVGGLIFVAVAAAWVAGQSAKGAAFFRFLREADIERRKVVWPSHQETLQTALMVLVVTLLISLFLAGVDWLLGALVRNLLGGG
jgi:preprotein translocase subunit SecE